MIVRTSGQADRHMKRCASWQGRNLLVDSLALSKSGAPDDSALQTAKALKRCGAEIYVLNAPEPGAVSGRAPVWPGSSAAGRYILQDRPGWMLVPADRDPLLELSGAAVCAVVGRYSSEHMPRAQSTGAVTIVASGDFPFWKAVLYLKTMLYFGEGDFCRGFDALKPSLLRKGREYTCFRTDASRVLYLG